MSSNVIQKNQQQQHSEQDSNQQPSYSTQHHSIRDFFLDYLKPIVASIVQETGFGAIESLDLLEILANIFNLYFNAIITRTAQNAQHSQRIQPNLTDVQFCFDQLYISSNSLWTYFHNKQIDKKSKNPVISPPISSSPNQEMQVFLDEPQLPFVDQSVQIPEWKNPHHPSLPAPHSYRKTKISLYDENDAAYVRKQRILQSRRVGQDLKELVTLLGQKRGAGGASDEGGFVNYIQYK